MQDNAKVQYENNWCPESSIPMSAVRLPPASSDSGKIVEGTEVEVYYHMKNTPYPAYWKGVVKVMGFIFI